MRSLILTAGLFVTACSNNAQVPLYKSVWEQIKDARAEKPEAVKKTPPRSEIDRVGVAMIQFNLEGEDIWPVMVPASANGPYVTYANQFRQTLTLRESQITATRGLGTDLLSADSSPDDPLKVLTPPEDWPKSVTRVYRFAGQGPEGRLDTYTCALTRGPAAQVTLAGTEFDVVGFAEACEGAAGSFTNLYAADATSGRVWQSRQFIGPDIAPIVLDILEPLTE